LADRIGIASKLVSTGGCVVHNRSLLNPFPLEDYFILLHHCEKRRFGSNRIMRQVNRKQLIRLQVFVFLPQGRVARQAVAIAGIFMCRGAKGVRNGTVIPFLTRLHIATLIRALT
jgi:hypothetical protein